MLAQVEFIANASDCVIHQSRKPHFFFATYNVIDHFISPHFHGRIQRGHLRFPNLLKKRKEKKRKEFAFPFSRQ